MSDRYNRLVTVLGDIIATQQTLNGLRTGSYVVPDHLRGQKIHRFKREIAGKRSALMPQHRANFNEYLRIILEEFDDMTPLIIDRQRALAMVGRVFTDPGQIILLSEDDLRQHEDIIVAIVTLRHLLINIRVEADVLHKTGGLFRSYMERYGAILEPAI